MQEDQIEKRRNFSYISRRGIRGSLNLPKCVLGPKKDFLSKWWQIIQNVLRGGVTELGTILKTKHSFRWFPNNQFPQSTCWVLQIQIGNSTRLVGKMLKSVMQLNSINFWYCFQFHGNSHEQASNAVLTDKWPHNVVLVTISQKNINRSPYLEGIKSSCPIFFCKT